MIVTTTPSVEGRTVTEYTSVVTGEAIMGANVFRDFFASITDIVGGRSAAYEKELSKARMVAMNEMVQQAEELGCDAVIGVDLDYEVIREGMLMVTVAGTAVKLK